MNFGLKKGFIRLRWIPFLLISYLRFSEINKTKIYGTKRKSISGQS